MATKKLLIVESPAKAGDNKKNILARTIQLWRLWAYNRPSEKVKMGIDFENDYTPKYITIRGKGQLAYTTEKRG